MTRFRYYLRAVRVARCRRRLDEQELIAWAESLIGRTS